MAEKQILVLPGDGIGPELIGEGRKVLDAVCEKYDHCFGYTEAPFGAESYLKNGKCFPDQTRKLVMDTSYDGIIKGPVGLDPAGNKRLRALGVKVEPETVLELRSQNCLNSRICYRPVVLSKGLAFFSPLRPEIVGDGIDVLMMRELVGGIYFGPKEEGVSPEGVIGPYARDDCTYTREQVEKFAEVCFNEAESRKSKLTLTHKDNVLAIGRYFKAIFDEQAKKHPTVPYEQSLIDSYFTKFKVKPTSFNGVVAFNNLDGDYTTDDGGGIIGSLGLMPSACWNPETKRGYFEPSHGSAPDIAGTNTANPYSMIGSVAFMLDIAFGMKEESKDVWDSLKNVFSQGYMTKELVRKLSEAEQMARAEDDLNRLYPAFHALEHSLSREQARKLIFNSNKQYDAGLEAKIVSTSQFGDLVVKNILGE